MKHFTPGAGFMKHLHLASLHFLTSVGSQKVQDSRGVSCFMKPTSLHFPTKM